MRAKQQSHYADHLNESKSDGDTTEVEYPRCKGCNKKVTFPDTKVKIDIPATDCTWRKLGRKV